MAASGAIRRARNAGTMVEPSVTAKPTTVAVITVADEMTVGPAGSGNASRHQHRPQRT